MITREKIEEFRSRLRGSARIGDSGAVVVTGQELLDLIDIVENHISIEITSLYEEQNVQS